jgi:hypothetical protein
MIIVFHSKEDLPHKLRWDINMCGLDNGAEEKHAAKVAEAFKAGYYEAVAVCNTNDLEDAWRWIQNGVATDSWCLAADLNHWIPIYPDFHLCADGRKLGRRSSMVGDVFNVNGEYHVCSSIGFTKLNLA